MVRAPGLPLPRTLLLVVPHQPGLLEGFSTGLIAIANYVRRHQPAVEVRLLDFGLLTEQGLAEAISYEMLAARGKMFVGITGTSASYQSNADERSPVQSDAAVVRSHHGWTSRYVSG